MFGPAVLQVVVCSQQHLLSIVVKDNDVDIETSIFRNGTNKLIWSGGSYKFLVILVITIAFRRLVNVRFSANELGQVVLQVSFYILIATVFSLPWNNAIWRLQQINRFQVFFARIHRIQRQLQQHGSLVVKLIHFTCLSVVQFVSCKAHPFHVFICNRRNKQNTNSHSISKCTFIAIAQVGFLSGVFLLR